MDPFERLRYVARRGSGSSSAVAIEAAPAFAALAGEPGALLTAARRLLDFHPICGPLWWMAAQTLAASDAELAAAFATAELEEDATARMTAAAVAERAPAVVVAVPAPEEHLLPALASARPPAVRIVADGWSQRRLIVGLTVELDGDGALDEGDGRGSRRDQRSRRGHAATEVDVTGWDPEDVEAALDDAEVALVEVLAAGPAGVVTPPGGLALTAAASRRRLPVWAVGGVGRVLPEELFKLVVARLDSPRAAAELVPAGDVTCYLGPAGAADPTRALTASDCSVPVELLRRAR